LADESVGRSDGVRYRVLLAIDGINYNNLLDKQVSGNLWETATFDIHTYIHQDLKIKLVSSSNGNNNYDWLQITLDLFPLVNLN
jgi:hypothetical protein